MKTFFKRALFLMFSLALGMNTTLAQSNPFFYIAWNGCKVETSNSTYKINYAIIEVPGPTVVVPLLLSPLTATAFENFIPVTISTWNCDQSSETYQYILYATVKLYAPGESEPYCSGELRTNAMSCSDLYDGLTFTVNMNY